MKQVVIIVVLVIVLLVIFIGRWQLDVGSDCTIEPEMEHSLVLYAQTPGVLTSFKYRSGDVVEKGSLLGKLTNIELQDDIEQLEASLKEALAQQQVLERQIQEKQQAVVSANLKKQKVYAEYNLAEIDMQDFNSGNIPPELNILKLKVDETEREYRRLETEQDKMNKSGLFPPDIESIYQQLKQAQTQSENQEFNYNKLRYLFSVGAVAQIDYESAKSRYEMSQSAVENYRAKLDDAKRNHYEETLRAKEAYLKAKEEFDIKQKEFFLEYDQLNYDTMIAGAEVNQASYSEQTYKAQIKENEEKIKALKQKQVINADKAKKLNLQAPATGVLIEEDITEKIGKHFDVGEKICEVAGLEEVLVNILVDEKDIGDVRQGFPVRLKVKPFMGNLFRGEVRKISPVSKYDEHKKRNFYSVELVIENPEDKLKPGMTGFAKINCGSRPIASLIFREIAHLIHTEYWFF